MLFSAKDTRFSLFLSFFAVLLLPFISLRLADPADTIVMPSGRELSDCSGRHKIIISIQSLPKKQIIINIKKLGERLVKI